MQKRFKIFSVAGIPVRAHESLLYGLVLLGIFVVFAGREEGVGVQTLLGVGLAIVAVLVHELGHAWIAKRLGVEVGEISLQMFFAMTRMQAPRSPKEEILIGVAGPLANLLVGLLLVPWVLSGVHFDGIVPETLLGTGFLIHMVLGTVNLIPAFPMDGGRILRAVLSLRMGDRRATRAAVNVGRVLAVAMIVAPLYLGFWPPSLLLPVMGVVVLFLSSQENRRIELLEEERRLKFQLEVASRSTPERSSPPASAVIPNEGPSESPARQGDP